MLLQPSQLPTIILLPLFVLATIVTLSSSLSPGKYATRNLADESSGRKLLVAPIVINTWNFRRANIRAWQEFAAGHSALDAIEMGCSQCEIDRCDGTVGWGGSPAETGETTLDAMIMDGQTYDVGAVGGLRRVKSAISVARMVLERTNHTLLVGEMATQFAIQLGFKEESLFSDESRKLHQDWLNNSCQPNYWKNVFPDPRESCGPYHVSGPIEQQQQLNSGLNLINYEPNKAPMYRVDSLVDQQQQQLADNTIGHDTIGMVAMDHKQRLVSGTSTNGLRYKILGRVGDSPVPGAGSYADRQAGAAAATGDGDVMMRFLLSYQAVENLRQGMSAQEAANDVIYRQIKRAGCRPASYPEAALVVLARDGSFGAACLGWSSKKFPFVVSDAIEQFVTYEVNCLA